MSEEIKHTKGPWHIDSCGIVGTTGFFGFRILNVDGQEVLDAKTHVLNSTYPRLQADAELMAVSPEIFLELKRHWVDGECYCMPKGEGNTAGNPCGHCSTGALLTRLGWDGDITELRSALSKAEVQL